MRTSLAILGLFALAGAHAAARELPQERPAQPAPRAAVGPIEVPRGTGVPVVTDGIFSPGEWDDALRYVVADGITLHLKEHGGVVFIGVRGPGANAIGPTELSLAPPGGPIVKLHVSFALYEVALPPTGDEPPARLGFVRDWYASELRRDEGEFARLRKEGKDPITVMQGSTYPSDGIEFAIRRSKIPGRVWLMRLWASALVGGKPGMVAYPPGVPERATDGWLELRFK